MVPDFRHRILQTNMKNSGLYQYSSAVHQMVLDHLFVLAPSHLDEFESKCRDQMKVLSKVDRKDVADGWIDGGPSTPMKDLSRSPSADNGRSKSSITRKMLPFLKSKAPSTESAPIPSCSDILDNGGGLITKNHWDAFQSVHDYVRSPLIDDVGVQDCWNATIDLWAALIKYRYAISEACKCGQVHHLEQMNYDTNFADASKELLKTKDLVHGGYVFCGFYLVQQMKLLKNLDAIKVTVEEIPSSDRVPWLTAQFIWQMYVKDHYVMTSVECDMMVRRSFPAQATGDGSVPLPTKLINLLENEYRRLANRIKAQLTKLFVLQYLLEEGS